MATIVDTDFESGLPAFTGTNGTPTISTAEKMHGLQSMECDGTSGPESGFFNAQRTGYTKRIYFKLAQVVSGDNIIASILNPPQNKAVDFGWNTVQAKYFLRSYDSTFSEIARAYSASGLGTGVWLRLGYRVDPSANPWVVKWQLATGDGSAFTETDFQPALTADTVAYDFNGIGATAAIKCYFDDYKLTDVLADYPLGPTAAPTLQYQRPSADLATALWVPTPSSPTTLFDKVDEASVSDTDYISATAT